jgi:hypothetical protein
MWHVLQTQYLVDFYFIDLIQPKSAGILVILKLPGEELAIEIDMKGRQLVFIWTLRQKRDQFQPFFDILISKREIFPCYEMSQTYKLFFFITVYFNDENSWTFVFVLLLAEKLDVIWIFASLLDYHRSLVLETTHEVNIVVVVQVGTWVGLFLQGLPHRVGVLLNRTRHQLYLLAFAWLDRQEMVYFSTVFRHGVETASPLERRSFSNNLLI